MLVRKRTVFIGRFFFQAEDGIRDGRVTEFRRVLFRSLTREENETLTRVGRGTPAGELLRRYWHPVAAAGELTDEKAIRAVKILGEELVVYRDKKGRYGLVGERCPHRSASLAF